MVIEGAENILKTYAQHHCRPSHFYVRYSNKEKCWEICDCISLEFRVKRSDLCVIKSDSLRKIIAFESIGELLFYLLQSNEWCFTLPSTERDALLDCINFVFLMQDDVRQSNYKLRYHCYMQFHGRKIIRGSDFLLDTYDLREVIRSMGLPDPKNAFDVLRLAREFKYSAEANSVKEFDNCVDLAWWALNDIVEDYKIIARCKVCGQYFIKSQQCRIYCSTDCASKGKKIGSYLDEPKIKSLSRIIDQRFTRKRKSNSLYLYNETTYGRDYNELDLFSDMEEKTIREDPTVWIFDSSHFEQMWKTYSGLRKDRYNKVRKAKKECLCGEISEKQYKMLLDSFVSWLENVVKQLGAFSFYSA